LLLQIFCYQTEKIFLEKKTSFRFGENKNNISFEKNNQEAAKVKRKTIKKNLTVQDKLLNNT